MFESKKYSEEVKFPSLAFLKSNILGKVIMSKEELNEDYLEHMRIIWFDPDIDSEENSRYRNELDKLFKMKEYTSDIESLERALKEHPDVPIIVISCGGYYVAIAELVQNSSQVVIIAIFCSYLKKHLPKLKDHIKIAAVINNFGNLKKELRKGYKNYIRFSYKFLDIAEEKTFYELKDQKEILAGQCMKGVFFEKESNITYPLYYGAFRDKERNKYDLAFHFEEQAWQESLERILFASTNNKFCLHEERGQLTRRIVEMYNERSPERIIAAYTGSGLHPMFGRVFRRGERKELEIFRLFAFALRGSMALLGDLISLPLTVFRGLNLKPEDIERWKDNIGKVVLLNGYTSTSMNKGVCLSPPFKGNCLLEFHFTKEVKAYEECLDVFNGLWSGYYSPVDIHKYSKCPGEKEILFPPFYPIRIKQITPPYRHPEGIFHIIIQAPSYINIGKGT